ncbi:MAG: hypothetical protein JWN20_2723 [Jatrophihabitantaceae bacterium]|nr:hypothetical protein [Jatrophihabitantaceae bacterium]
MAPLQGDHPAVTLLADVRVLDLTDGKGEMCGRYLADLGAEVILVEPPTGASSRRLEPIVEGASLYFATHNANKRSVTLDLAAPDHRRRFLDLVATADILIESFAPGHLTSLGLDAAALQSRRPALVVVSITDFGQDGPYSGYIATNLTISALSAVLDRSGNPGREPIPAPGRLVTEAAVIQAAWAALLAYANAVATGVGDHVDASLLELSISAFDPGFGVAGSARSTLPADGEALRGRPDSSHLYPIVACADGSVRFCLLAPRQWRGMFALIGEPAEFADPKYDTILNRFAEWDRLLPVIAAAFRDKTKADLVAAGKALRIPLTDVLTLGESMAVDHFAARGAFVDVEVAPGVKGKLANGFLLVDGVRAGIRSTAPALGEGNASLLDRLEPYRAPQALAEPVSSDPARPLAGLKILDLGVIVMGAELPRLFADMGADVVTVENAAFPDGMRQVPPGEVITQSFVWGHRNKRSLGLDLRRPGGAALFARLAAEADVVMSNFKPGTMQALGLGDDALRSANPRLVIAESSALGASGPWSDRMGYGPLIRASTALSAQWRYPGSDSGYCDTNTVYPDHAAARVEAVAILAAVLRARRTGVGASISAAQAETILSQLSELYLEESLAPGSMQPMGNASAFDAPFGAYPCAGDDEWCAIEVRGDGDWKALTSVLGGTELADDRLATAAGRVARRAEVDAAVSAWRSRRSPLECMEVLQAAGVPAGAMARVPDLLDDPHLVARGFWRTIHQPQRPEAMPTENGPARFRTIAEPAMGPAPLQGEHSRQVLREWLALTEAEVDRLVDDGVVESL